MEASCTTRVKPLPSSWTTSETVAISRPHKTLANFMQRHCHHCKPCTESSLTLLEIIVILRPHKVAVWCHYSCGATYSLSRMSVNQQNKMFLPCQPARNKISTLVQETTTYVLSSDDVPNYDKTWLTLLIQIHLELSNLQQQNLLRCSNALSSSQDLLTGTHII